MATTTRGYPYPLGTDRVADGDDAIHALAALIDERLGYGCASGEVTMAAPGTVGTTTNATVTFPVGLFSQPPKVFGNVTANGAPSAFYGVVVGTTPTASGTTIFCTRFTAPTSAIVVNWFAHGR